MIGEFGKMGSLHAKPVCFGVINNGCEGLDWKAGRKDIKNSQNVIEKS